MSHELRTPLNAINGCSDLLLDDAQRAGCTPTMAADLRQIQDVGVQLRGRVNDVLDLSKIDAGQMRVRRGDVALGPLPQDVVNTVQPLAGQNGNALALLAPAPG